jgi:RNA polymerase sigma-70 factor (ECF subfamily)
VVTKIDSAPLPRGPEEQVSLQLLRRALRALRPEEQEVFLLRQNGELTYHQIAERSNRPLGVVKAQMRSALQKLRQTLNASCQRG